MTDTIDTATRQDIPSLAEYRAQARAWISANLERNAGDDPAAGIVALDPSEIPAAKALQLKMYEAGYAGISWPAEYGGQGLPPEYELAFLDEARGYKLPCYPSYTLYNGTFNCNVPTMLVHGQPEFLRWFVPQVLRGEIETCKFFSEPSGGSDLGGVRTRAVRDGDTWVLTGQKIWSTHAHLANWGFCLARTDWDVPKHRGLTWFVFPTDLPGVTIRQIKRVDETGEFCEDFFDEVVVPDLYRIGEVNDGWAVTQTMLVYERGAGKGAIGDHLAGPGPLAPDLVEEAQRLGLTSDPLVRQKVARGHMIDFVTRSLAWRIALAGQAGGFNPGLAAYGKLFRGTYSPVRGRLPVEIGGAGAMTWEPGSEDRERATDFLNSKVIAIAAGTNEMQRNGISERILGMPRELSVDTRRPYREVIREEQGWSAPRV
jgi:alkylation response protein AidB-like acyl-CoA dehydrogenase